MTDQKIGALDTRLTLETPDDTPDTGGGATSGWSIVGDLWANVRPVTGSDRFLSDALRSQVSHRITIRYRAGITAAQRLRNGDRIYRIGAVLDRGRRNRLVLLCLEEQA